MSTVLAYTVKWIFEASNAKSKVSRSRALKSKCHVECCTCESVSSEPPRERYGNESHDKMDR